MGAVALLAMDALRQLNDAVDAEIFATPAAKRRRRVPCKSTTVATSDDGSGGTASLATTTSPASSDVFQSGRTCCGCFRINGIGFSFTEVGTLVLWGDPRGNWCGRCTVVWRTNLQGTMSLTQLESWIQSPDDFDEWRWLCVAHDTLREEPMCHWDCIYIYI